MEELITYRICYYGKFGGHGHTSDFFFNIKSARIALKSFVKNVIKDECDETDKTLMAEIQSTGKEFVVGYMTKDYLNIIDSKWFNNPSNYYAFKAVAEKCLKTGKTITSKYPF